MIRGVRGATTINNNCEKDILLETEILLSEMIRSNHIEPEEVAHIIMTTTDDITAAFPAKILRNMEGFKYVPIMCMKELSVDNALSMCIRVMITINTNKSQKEIQHIYLNNAISLRPDLVN